MYVTLFLSPSKSMQNTRHIISVPVKVNAKTGVTLFLFPVKVNAKTGVT